MTTEQSPPTIVITSLASAPRPPETANAAWPNVLHTRVAEVVRQMGPPPWSRRLIADERQLVTLIASPPGGGNRPHWHRDFDEWWVVLEGLLEWELTGGIVLRATKGRHRLGAAGNRASHSQRGRAALVASRRGHAAGGTLLQPMRAVRLHGRRAARMVRVAR